MRRVVKTRDVDRLASSMNARAEAVDVCLKKSADVALLVRSTHSRANVWAQLKEIYDSCEDNNSDYYAKEL